MSPLVRVVPRVLALAGVLFVVTAVAAQVSGVGRMGAASMPAAADRSDGAAAAGALLLFCVLAAAVFSWMIRRSRLRGGRLVAAVFLAYFGLGTVLPQIESAVFLPRHLPPGFLPRLFAMGALTAALFAPAAVWIHGRLRAPAEAGGAAGGLAGRQWIARLALLAAAYVAIYFLAGYFIAYRDPAVVAYYDDVHTGSFTAQLGRAWAHARWLFGLQALRALLWVGCVVPFVLSFNGRRWELAPLLGGAFSVWALMLLAPNPYMPERVRMAHLLETGPSNFLFGCLAGVLLSAPRPGAPPRATSRS